MTEYVRVPVVLTCNSDVIAKTLAKKKMKNLFFSAAGQDECSQQGLAVPIRMLILQTQEELTHTEAYDYALFDVVLLTGAYGAAQSSCRHAANVVCIPDEEMCISFFLLLYSTYNSLHLIGYDLCDLLPHAGLVLHGLCTERYDELDTFARCWGGNLSASQTLVLVALDYDFGNPFSFSEKAFALLDGYADRNFNALVVENYNEHEGWRYYQGFVLQRI